MTPDKGVEAFYQHMLKSTPVLDEFERASLKLKVKELFTQHHQDISTALVEALEGKKQPITIEDRVESAFASIEWDRYNQALTQAQNIIRTLLESK